MMMFKHIEEAGFLASGFTLFDLGPLYATVRQFGAWPAKAETCQALDDSGAEPDDDLSAHGNLVAVSAIGSDEASLIEPEMLRNRYADLVNGASNQNLDDPSLQSASAWATAAEPAQIGAMLVAKYPHWMSWRQRPKRIFDITFALIACLLVAPLMLIIALVVFLQDFGPVLFTHRRIGEGGREFHCYKFRTMAPNADKLLADYLARDPANALEWQCRQKLAVDPRVTKLGRLLRMSSVDELPQLLNVLKGEMSLIGPRPIVSDECPRYGRHIKEYRSVKPGMTGLWQVSGRNDTTYRRRVAMDAYYARNISFKLDLLIILKTLPAVVLGRGCS